MIFSLLSIWNIFLQIGNETISTNSPSSDLPIPYSLIGSVIIAIVLGSTLLLNIYTIRQNTDERKLRQRPWLSNREGPYKTYDVTSDTVDLNIVNDGSVPAYNLTYSTYLFQDPPTEDIFIKNDSLSDKINPDDDDVYDLGPNEHFRLFIQINNPVYRKIIDSKSGILYFGFLLTYRDAHGDLLSIERRFRYTDGFVNLQRTKHLPHPK